MNAPQHKPSQQTLFVSLSVHESEPTVIDQCLNYIVLGGVDGVVININPNSRFNVKYLKKLASHLDGNISSKIIINPHSVAIIPHSRNRHSLTSLHRAHLQNFLFLNSMGIDFTYFAMDASNSLLIRPGLKAWVTEHAPLCSNLDHMRSDWFWNKDALSDVVLHDFCPELMCSQHEGCVYDCALMGKIMDHVLAYERAEKHLMKSGYRRPEYPREEVLFPSFLKSLINSSPVSPAYIHMPWERDLKWTQDEVFGIIGNDFTEFVGKFGIKRVSRYVNDPIRVAVGRFYGYR